VSTVKNPVGPESPNTYWLRRAVVLVVLVVILFLGWLLLRALFGSSAEPEAQPASASTSPAASASPDADESVSASPVPSASDTSPSSSPSASTTCSDSDIEVGASTQSTSTSVGAGMGLTMTVANTGDAACNRDVGAVANELRITSGSALVWSSDFCSPSTKSDVVALVPGTPFTTSVSWSGTITAKDCPADQPQAQPGTYKVRARNGDVKSKSVTFTVQ
jgi:cytoskeletal protein RodZ